MREKDQPKLSFHFVTLEETLKEVALLSDKKASQTSDIPIKIIKENRDLIEYFILHLKHADITPIFKNDDKTDKANSGPRSVLPNLSKIYEQFK